MTNAHVLEAAMLICFGLAWPVANLQMLQTGKAQGKGLPLNAASVALNLALQRHCGLREARRNVAEVQA